MDGTKSWYVDILEEDPLLLLRESAESFYFDHLDNLVKFPKRRVGIGGDSLSGVLDRNKRDVKAGVLAHYLQSIREGLDEKDYMDSHLRYFSVRDAPLGGLDNLGNFFEASSYLTVAVTVRIPRVRLISLSADFSRTTDATANSWHFPPLEVLLKDGRKKESSMMFDLESANLDSGKQFWKRRRLIQTRQSILTIDSTQNLFDRYKAILERDQLDLVADVNSRGRGGATITTPSSSSMMMMPATTTSSNGMVSTKDGNTLAGGKSLSVARPLLPSGSSSSSVNNCNSTARKPVVPILDNRRSESLLEELHRISMRSRQAVLILTPPSALAARSPVMHRSTLLYLLRDGRYMPFAEAEAAAAKMLKDIQDEEIRKKAHVWRITPDAARDRIAFTVSRHFNEKILDFYIVPNKYNLLSLKPQDWRLVSCVFVANKSWQFDNYPIKKSSQVIDFEPAKVFSIFKGFHLHLEGTQVPETIEKWNVAVLTVKPHDSHETILLREQLWGLMGSFLNKPRDNQSFEWNSKKRA